MLCGGFDFLASFVAVVLGFLFSVWFSFVANRLLQPVLWSLAVIFARPLSKPEPEFVLFFWRW
jgi:type IV secretory pathway TrbD component